MEKDIMYENKENELDELIKIENDSSIKKYLIELKEIKSKNNEYNNQFLLWNGMHYNVIFKNLDILNIKNKKEQRVKSIIDKINTGILIFFVIELIAFFFSFGLNLSSTYYFYLLLSGILILTLLILDVIFDKNNEYEPYIETLKDVKNLDDTIDRIKDILINKDFNIVYTNKGNSLLEESNFNYDEILYYDDKDICLKGEYDKELDKYNIKLYIPNYFKGK